MQNIIENRLCLGALFCYEAKSLLPKNSNHGATKQIVRSKIFLEKGVKTGLFIATKRV